MIHRLYHQLRYRLWPKCCCRELRVAPGTRTELAGVSHGDTPCFHVETT
jgi:hypothetical protein